MRSPKIKRRVPHRGTWRLRILRFRAAPKLVEALTDQPFTVAPYLLELVLSRVDGIQPHGNKPAILPNDCLAPNLAALGRIGRRFLRDIAPLSTGVPQRIRLHGELSGGALAMQSRMNDGGVIFTDGIEQDFLAFDRGRQLHISVSGRKLCLGEAISKLCGMRISVQ